MGICLMRTSFIKAGIISRIAHHFLYNSESFTQRQSSFMEPKGQRQLFFSWDHLFLFLAALGYQ